jgi:hypothetical protein
MSTVQEIENAIQGLRPEEVEELKAWLFDREIEADAEAGRLDSFAEEALREHREGRTRPL